MCLMGNNVSRCLVAVCANQFVPGSTRLFLKLRKFNSIKWIAFLAYMMFGLRSNRMEKVSRFGFRWVFSSVVRIFGWLNLQFIPLVRYCAELVNLYLIWKRYLKNKMMLYRGWKPLIIVYTYRVANLYK